MNQLPNYDFELSSEHKDLNITKAPSEDSPIKTNYQFSSLTSPTNPKIRIQKHSEFYYDSPQNPSMSVLKCLTHRYLKILGTLVGVWAMVLWAVDTWWDMGAFVHYCKIALYIICLEALWKSFYGLLFIWQGLKSQPYWGAWLGGQAALHYVIVGLLYSTRAHELCLQKQDDHLYCFIKIDLIIDLLKLLTASILYFGVSCHPGNSFQKFRRFMKYHLVEHILMALLIPLIPLDILLIYLCASMIIIRIIVFIY